MAPAAIPELVVKLRQAQAHLHELLARIDLEWLERAAAPGHQWQGREVLAHLANAEEDHRQVAVRLLRGEATTLNSFDLNRWNEERVAGRAAQSVQEILADFDQQRALTIAFVETLAPADLDKSGEHPALGVVTLGKLLRIIPLHQRAHHKEIAVAE
jgi:hypothetical protein